MFIGNMHCDFKKLLITGMTLDLFKGGRVQCNCSHSRRLLFTCHQACIIVVLPEAKNTKLPAILLQLSHLPFPIYHNKNKKLLPLSVHGSMILSV